jgi:oligopeptide transport system substrate-binding protein
MLSLLSYCNLWLKEENFMKKNTRHFIGKLSLTFALLFTFSNCTKSGGSSANGKKILRLGNGSELQDIDPQTVTGVPEHNVISALFEGLIVPHPETLEPQPGVAESWTISKDQKIYTFKIRETAKWSNGDKITAEDYIFSWKRMLSPKLGAEYAYMLFPVKNAEEYSKGTLKDFSQVGVKAKNPLTLEITLKAPTPYFLALLMHYSTYAVHKPTIEKFNAMESRGTKWTRPENFVGNGPFKLTKWDLNKVLMVERNPNYWNNQITKLDGISFHPVELAQTEERMYRSGELDKTNSVPTHKIDNYRKDRPKEFVNAPYLGTYFYRINTTRPQLKDVRVRKALSMSIDRQAIVDKVTKAGEIPAKAFTPPNTGGYTSKAEIKFDIAGAKKLLAEAGFPEGKGFKGVEILYNTLEAHRSIAESIQQMWKVNLGIDVTLKNQEWKVYIDSQHKKDYDIARAGWIGDYSDPNSFLDLWTTDNGNNDTGFANKKYDSIIRTANMTGDSGKRLELFNQAEEILLSELPIIPIYTYTVKYLLNERVVGWKTNILDFHPYQYLDIK